MKKYRFVFLLSIISVSFLSFARANDYYNSVVSLIENHNATIGFAAICDDEIFAYNGDEAFPLLSVYKIAVAKCVLEKLEKEALSLDYKIQLNKNDLDKNTYSPILSDFDDDEFIISVRELIKYALIKSDNNANDILIDFAGGIKNVKKSVLKNTKKLKMKNQFDILETEKTMHHDLQNCYNNWATPVFMARYFEKCLHSENITKENQKFLNECLASLETGTDRIVKGLPADTKFAHKTGTGPRMKDGKKIAWNDCGVIYLPDGRECAICIFIKDSFETDEADSLLMQKIASATYNYFMEN